MKLLARLITGSSIFVFCLLFLNKAQANIILIQTDDQAIKTIKAKYRPGKLAMPNLNKLLIDKGVYFNNHYAASPLCAPSRAALLSGRYPHNNGVVSNRGENGGWLGLMNSDVYQNNFVNRLDQAGYRTTHLGKLTNFYGQEGEAEILPGFDNVLTDYQEFSTSSYYGYYQRARLDYLGIDQIIGPIGSRDYRYMSNLDSKSCWPIPRLINNCFYHTDFLTNYAVKEINQAQKEKFYIQIDYHAPHGDGINPIGPQPATRHLLSADKTPLLKTKNYNYADKNKPFLIRRDNGRLNKGFSSYPRDNWRRSLEALRAVDDGISQIVKELKKTGQYKNTYIIFTSDNGLFYGEHRFLTSKFLAYQESANIPLIITGPGIKKGVSNFPTSTVDIAPTILDLASIKRNGYKTDGLSLKKELSKPAIYPNNNQRVQIIENIGKEKNQFIKEIFLNPNRSANRAPSLNYQAIKIGRYKYIDYLNTTSELYDLKKDPYELNNLATKNSSLLKYLKNNLAQYRDCQEKACLIQPKKPSLNLGSRS